MKSRDRKTRQTPPILAFKSVSDLLAKEIEEREIRHKESNHAETEVGEGEEEAETITEMTGIQLFAKLVEPIINSYFLFIRTT